MTDLVARLIAAGTPADLVGEVAMLVAEARLLDSRKANEAARTARYRSRGGGNIPPEMRAAVFERDGFACVYCGSGDHLQCDHDVPVSRGGETTEGNLVTACRPCNARKKDRDRKAFQRMSTEVRGQNGHPRKSADTDSPSIKNARVASARAEPKITNSSSPSQEIKKEEKQKEAGSGANAPVSVLETVLDPDRAKAVVEHRSRMGKGKALTENSARLLASRLAACSDPNAAADEMIVRGWMSVKPDWLQDRATGPPGRPTNGHSAPPLTGYTQVLHDLRRQRDEDHAEPTVPLLPRH